MFHIKINSLLMMLSIVHAAFVLYAQKASDRSWKPMWAVLRGHVLLLYKDKSSVVSIRVYMRLHTCSPVDEVLYSWLLHINIFDIGYIY